jgi:hypothetical protein
VFSDDQPERVSVRFCWFRLPGLGAQPLIAEQRKRVVDIIVYRPAGGAGQHKSRRLRLGGKRNTVQKVAGTLRVPSAEPQKAKLFEGYGTWNVPTTLLH